MFRPKSSLFYGFSVFLFCTGITFAYFYESDPSIRIAAILINAFFCFAAYLLFIKPKVTFYDEGIVINNPLVEYTIGWGDIESIEARYTMYVQIGAKKIYAWAAPGPGRYHARSVHPSELRGMGIPDLHNMRPGESPRTHSGVATQIARRRLEEFHRNTFPDIAFNRKVEVRAFATMMGLLATTIISIVL